MPNQRAGREHAEGKPLCTTIPTDLITSVKVLAKDKSVLISQIVVEAIEDLLTKYDRLNPNHK